MMTEKKEPKKRRRTRRKISASGKVYYTYPKKHGPHKKPGPKKKKILKKRGRKKLPERIYRIVIFDLKKEKKVVGKYATIQEVEAAKEELLKKNSTIVFPKKYINNAKVDDNVYENNLEYVVLQRCDADDDGITQLRNEFGKVVDHKTSSGEWKVLEKFPCLIEDTFYAYGYTNNKNSNRKTFDWIYENFVIPYSTDKYSFVNIYVYGNKVIFRYDDDFNFVACKNISDAIRMYNLLEERCKKNKQVFFTGFVYGHSDRTAETNLMIQKKTGWSLEMTAKASTRH